MRRRFARLGILLLALAVPFVVWRLWLTSDVNRRLAAVRAAGLPANGEKLNRWYPAVPDKENALLVLTQAFAQPRSVQYRQARKKQILCAAFGL